jgi:membrane protease YdiL (CAAX protease family)
MDMLTSGNVPYAVGLLIGLVALFWWMNRWSRRGPYRQGAWIGLGGAAALGLLFAVVHLAYGDRHQAFLSMLVAATLGLNGWICRRRIRPGDPSGS